MRALGPAWLRGDPAALRLLPAPTEPGAFAPPEGWTSAPASAAAEEVLRDLNPGCDLSMDAAVVTGQQLGLFGGPCMTLYKAWTAVAWARALSAAWGLRVRPVFWLQSEDHDYAEVAWCGGPGGERINLPVDEERVSLSQRRVPADVGKALDAFAESVGPGLHRADVLEKLERAWQPGRSWTEAFVEILRWAFADQDLLLFDPRHPAAGAGAAFVHERALFDCRALGEELRARAKVIEGEGFRVQVPIRAETLSFAHLDDLRGPRHRLRWRGQAEALAPDGRVLSSDTLRGWLARSPLRFSASALLRPLVQDHLLPTVAYVAGPGEAAYWAQLPPLYAAFAKRMPRVLPRARIRLLEPWARRLLERHRLTSGDAERGIDGLLERMELVAQGAPASDIAAELDRKQSEIAALLRERSEKLDVEGPLGALDRKMERSFGRFVQKYENIRRRSDADGLAAARRLDAAFAPGGAPQERWAAFAGYFARHGRDHVMARLRDSWSPGRVEPVDVPL